MVFPPALHPGSKIAVISPAGYVENEQISKTLDLIRSENFTPVLGSYVTGKRDHGYLYSGSEKERIEDLNWALNDPSIEAIWASRGGYGCQHLLQEFDSAAMLKNPKWYIGYSDNTVLQSKMYQLGVASIHGQTLKTSSFGVSPSSYSSIFSILRGAQPSYSFSVHPSNKPGEVSGRIVGGNLALVYALLGTPYSIDFEGNLLFIEEIGEEFYALDRMLMSLEHAGVFNKISGLIVGGMINMGKENTNPYYEASFDPFAYTLISERLEKYSFPVAYQFPNGHIFDNRPLIIGARYRLDSTRGTLFPEHL